MTAALRLFLPDDEGESDAKSMRTADPHALCPKGRWPLRKCCEEWIFPRLDDEQTATRRLFLDALAHWEARTSNPGVGETEQTHVDALWKSMRDARQPNGKPYSRETLRKTWRYLSRILRIARDRGLLDKLPTPDALPPVGRRVRTVPSADLNAFYRACESATWPVHPQISPADFWRTALVMWVFYGPRCMDLLGRLPWRGEIVETDWPAVGIYREARCPCADIDRLGLRSKHGWLVYRPTKSKRIKPEPLILPLNRVTRAHLDRIAGDRELVLPISKANHALGEQWERLLIASGISKEFWFTRHDLRRTCESRYGDIGEHITGHAPRTVSGKYYRQFARPICEAIRTAKVPAAFKAIYGPVSPAAEADPQKRLF